MKYCVIQKEYMILKEWSADDMDIEKFANDWIAELIADMQLIIIAEKYKTENWTNHIKWAIELQAWESRYRKVSQLCHEIGGDILNKFESKFFDGVETYKHYL